MTSETLHEMYKARALEPANLGISSTTAADHATARDAWQDAFDYAEQHLPSDDITNWVRSGLGAALLEVGDYYGALEMAGSRLEWCASHRAPLASVIMAKSLLLIGDVTRAQIYARQACDLRGKRI